MSPRRTNPVKRRPTAIPTTAWPSSWTRVTAIRSTRQRDGRPTTTRATSRATPTTGPSRATSPDTGTTRDVTWCQSTAGNLADRAGRASGGGGAVALDEAVVERVELGVDLPARGVRVMPVDDLLSTAPE